MAIIGLLGSYIVITAVTGVTGIPRTFRKREKIAIPKIVITLVALCACVLVCVCVIFFSL